MKNIVIFFLDGKSLSFNCDSVENSSDLINWLSNNSDIPLIVKFFIAKTNNRQSFILYKHSISHVIIS